MSFLIVNETLYHKNVLELTLASNCHSWRHKKSETKGVIHLKNFSSLLLAIFENITTINLCHKLAMKIFIIRQLIL